MTDLKRFGVSVDKDLLQQFDELIAGTYDNRSEAIRDLIRDKIVTEKAQEELDEVIGVLTLIYNHHQHNLPDKLVGIECDYNCLFKSNLHLYLDQKHCLEVVVIQGPTQKIQKVAHKLSGLKGVKHSKLNLTTTEPDL
ncbi:nickel-responsive transcriptional regulator NikR [Halanaerobacter jeridensis]|uniref:Putative nickel-responsive regulator n=1 Tax=Halanaerobacter jeridensis TaxID=706427 RepID=A0A939BQ38_9FIRM|nr:nickel-responsive transcriptional regulator NikR [Halanaerobacter jeridensis]MBM7557648.1 CopG family nickel-responsive transcriptional regulator [Halanaerobacter jeridensis]